MPRFRSLQIRILKDLETELSPNLTYHGFHHTRDVYDVCNGYIRRLSIKNPDATLLRTAVLFHDYGFITDYKNHEEIGVEYAKQILPDYGYSSPQIKRVSAMIMATKIPQNPKTELERIICDADLDYLGRDDFKSIGETLFMELKKFTPIATRTEWNTIQYNFLSKHRYHTPFARKYREPKKQENLEIVKKWLKRNAPGVLEAQD